MFMETGTFGTACLSDGSFFEAFAARVVIPDSEFPALGLGDHEDPSHLPPCFRWCVETLGPGGSRWAPELADPAVVLVNFRHIDDAIAFIARWNACKNVEPFRAAA